MTVQDTGPLDWRIAITDQAGRPTPEFQRRWAIQRNNNAQIGSVTFGSGAPTGSPADGAEYVDTSVTPYVLYIGQTGAWHQVSTKIFTDLIDVPHSYSGHTSQIVRVNSAGNALEFVTESTLLDEIGSTQGDILYRSSTGWVVLAPGTSGDVLTTGGASANPSWAPGGGGGGGQHEYEAFGALPTTSNFPTTVHIVGTSITNGSAALILQGSGGSNTLELYVDSAPGSTPWNVYARFDTNLNSSTPGQQVGIALRNSGSGNVIAYGTGAQGTGASNAVQLQNWTSPTAFSATIANLNDLIGPVRWLRVSNTGTNLVYYYSNNGLDWIQLGSFSLASFISSVDQIGIYMNPGGSGQGFSFVGSYGTTAPT